MNLKIKILEVLLFLLLFSCKKAPKIELNEVKKESVEFYLSLEKIVEQAHEDAMKIDTIIPPEHPINPYDTVGEKHIEYLIRGSQKFGDEVTDKEEKFYYKSTVKINGKEQEVADSVIVSDPKKKLLYRSMIHSQKEFGTRIIGKIEENSKDLDKALTKTREITKKRKKLLNYPKSFTSVPKLKYAIEYRIHLGMIFKFKDYNTHQLALKRLESKIIKTNLLSSLISKYYYLLFQLLAGTDGFALFIIQTLTK